MKKSRILTSTMVATGRQHLSARQPCQDAAGCLNTQAVSGVCLADGAGSASASQLGARIAVQTTIRYVEQNFQSVWENPAGAVASLLSLVLQAISERAQAEQLAPKDLACTLLFTFAAIGNRHVRYVCGNLGDGVILMRRGRDLSRCLGPDNGEYANQTWFVTSSSAERRLTIVSGECDCSDIPGWVLTTDGAAPFLCNNSATRIAPAVLSILEDVRTRSKRRRERTLPGFVNNVILPRAFDDCSVGIVQIDAHGKDISRRAMV